MIAVLRMSRYGYAWAIDQDGYIVASGHAFTKKGAARKAVLAQADFKRRTAALRARHAS